MEFLRLLSVVNAKRPEHASNEIYPGEEPTAVRKTLAVNLRLFRDSLGLSQEDLAKRSGLTQSRVWRIENTAPNIRLDTLTVLAKHLERSEVELLTALSEPEVAHLADLAEQRRKRWR